MRENILVYLESSLGIFCKDLTAKLFFFLLIRPPPPSPYDFLLSPRGWYCFSQYSPPLRLTLYGARIMVHHVPVSSSAAVSPPPALVCAHPWSCP